MSAVAIFGNFIAVEGLVTQGDPARTAADIRASQGLFRLGIVSLIFVIALDVVVAWALYRVFSPVDKSLSLLAAALRSCTPASSWWRSANSSGWFGC